MPIRLHVISRATLGTTLGLPQAIVSPQATAQAIVPNHPRRTKVCKKLRRHYVQMAQLGELRALWLDGRGFESHPRHNIFALFMESNYTWNQII